MICTKSFDVLNFTNFKVSIQNVIKVLLETFKSKTCTSNHVIRAQFNFVYFEKRIESHYNLVNVLKIHVDCK